MKVTSIQEDILSLNKVINESYIKELHASTVEAQNKIRYRRDLVLDARNHLLELKNILINSGVVSYK